MKKKLGRKPKNRTHKIKALSAYLFGRDHGEFARIIQISNGQLSSILSGKRKASLVLVNRIALETEMQVTLEDLRPDLYESILRYNEIKKEDV